MASSQSNIKRTKIPEPNQDLISNLPSHLAEKILKRLPLSMAAKTSVLSRKWRRYWLSIRHLVFDYTFWEEHKISGHYDYQNISNIISNILLHHNGPIHEFYLYVPQHPQLINLNLSQWLSFLSRAGIRRLSLTNFVGFGGAPKTILPSCIFACSELVKLKLHCYELNYTPPSDCMGFAHLRTLKLLLVKFKHGGLFTSLMSSCPRLTTLSLEYCTGFSDLKFEHASILESLTIQGSFVPLDFKNASYLKRVSLSFSRMEYTSHTDRLETVSAIKILAIPQVKLEYLQLDGTLCKFLAAGCNNKLTLTFNHLQKLCLTKLDLDDFNVFGFTISMVQNCPYIKDLELSFTPNKCILQHKFDYDDNYKLGQLIKAKITGFTGSSVELKLIEYLLGISVVLEKLLLKCSYLDSTSELKVLRELLQLPRASTKAKIVYLAQ